MHAMKFFKYIMGAHFDIDEVFGPLPKGRVSRVLAARDPTEQARPLTVAEVCKLEIMLETVADRLDQYYIGCHLYALYSRSRWSDMANMQSFGFDIIDTEEGPFGFVEGKTRIRKTSAHAERKAMYMPYVAPITGVSASHGACSGKRS